jgi:hypothetical protein
MWDVFCKKAKEVYKGDHSLNTRNTVVIGRHVEQIQMNLSPE